MFCGDVKGSTDSRLGELWIAAQAGTTEYYSFNNTPSQYLYRTLNIY